MKIIFLSEDQRVKEPLVSCIGYFDGLHKGHQKLVLETKKIAKEKKTASGLITFFPDPYERIHHTSRKHIQDFESRIKIIESFHLDYCIVLPFDDALANMSPEEFIQYLKEEFNLSALVCGFDFHFGAKGKGDYYLLRRHFDTTVVEAVTYRGEKISSSRIREMIEKGEITLANDLLGYDYFIKGNVIHGKGNGKAFGFPTANIEYSDEIVLPKVQVYRGYCKVEDKYYRAMINFGNNPTIAHDNPNTLEAYLFDFEGDLYDKEIVVYLKDVLREEKKFASIEELIAQMKKDQDEVRNHEWDGRFIL